jgi:hypothetical protein
VQRSARVNARPCVDLATFIARRACRRCADTARLTLR